MCMLLCNKSSEKKMVDMCCRQSLKEIIFCLVFPSQKKKNKKKKKKKKKTRVITEYDINETQWMISVLCSPVASRILKLPKELPRFHAG